MLFETTHIDKNVTKYINETLGRSFSFINRIKLGGVGSKRMIIEAVSEDFNKIMNAISDFNYANIELRPKGILVRTTKGLRRFTWVIPYYQLVVYKTNGFSIHAQGNFIRFANNRLLRENKKFINKMLSFRENYISQHHHS